MRIIWPTGRGVFYALLMTFVLVAASTTVTAQAGFTISATPSSLSIPQNGQGVAIITTSISGGFNADIGLSASGLPSGVTVSFDPQTIPAPGSGNSTMTISVGTSAPAGAYPITVTGDGGGIQQNTTVNLTVLAAGSWQQGFDFRNTKNFVSDPSGSTYVLATTAYPTKGNGVTYGWVKTSLVRGADRNSQLDPRLAGVNLVNNRAPATFYVDLPAPGVYNVSLALGDAGAKRCRIQCQVQFLDGSTVLATITGGVIDQGYFYDAKGNSWSAAAWPGSNVNQQVTLIGTRLTVLVGTNNTGDVTPVAFLGVAQASGAPNFSLSASPASLTIQQGNQATSTITTTINGGFNSAIALSASGVPFGASVSFNPSAISAPGVGSSTMTVTVGSNSPAGTYPITVTGNGGGIQQNTTVTLTVLPVPIFMISVSPASLTIQQGNQGNSTITTTISGGFNADVTLSASGMPSGVTVSFNPQTIPAPGAGSSAMAITVGNSTPTGTYPIIVTGNGGGIQQNTTVTITVTAAPSFTLSASPASLSIQQGNQGTSTITTTISGGFSADITLSAAGMPSGVTVGFNPQTIPAPGAGSSTMTITVANDTPVGTYPITVTGNGGGIQQNTTVTLTVTAAPSDFTIALSPSSVTVQQGLAGNSVVTTTIMGTFNSSIDLSAAGVPTGTTVSFNPQTIPAPGAGTSAVTIAVGTNTPLGTYPITVTGNGGGNQHTATLNLTVTGWAQGFDFRNTAGFVMDPPNYNYVLPGTTYPTIVNGVSFGWTTPDLVQGGDRSTSVDPRLAGINSAQNGSPATFYLDLPSPGAYNVSLAMGDDGFAQCGTQCEVELFDGSTPVATVSGGPTNQGYFYDAAGNNWSDAAWPTSNVSQQVTVAGTRLTVVVGTNNATGDMTPIASLGVVQTPSFTITASPASLSILQGNQDNSVITTTISGGFSADVTLSATGMPSGTTVSFAPQTIPAPGAGSSTMTITVGSNTPTGTYPITVTGNGSGIQQTTTVMLTVTAAPNFTISASPASLSIQQGNQGTSTITATISGGFNGAITLSVSGMPLGVTASFNPQTIPAPGAGSSTMTITVGNNAAPGTYPITVTGNGGGVQQNTTVTLTVSAAGPTYTLTAAPASLSMIQGSQNSGTIVTSISGGFNSPINLSASGTPLGVSVSFNPSTIPAPGSGISTMTVTVLGLARVGTFSIAINASGGGIKQSATVTLTVTAQGQPNFTLSASPTLLSVVQGTQGVSTLTTMANNGFSGDISFSASGMPAGITVNFNPLTIPAPGNGSSIMTITVSSSLSSGTYPITVTGSSGSLWQTTAVTVMVGSFTPLAAPASLSIAPGNQGTSQITTTVNGGFNYPISLSASGMPSGTTVNFNPPTIPAPGAGSSIMTVTVGSNTPVGTYPITVTAIGGGLQQNLTMTLTVPTAGFTLSVFPASVSVVPNTLGILTATTRINGFNNSINLVAAGAPHGLTVGFSPTVIPAPGVGNATITVVAFQTVPAGSYPITVTASGGGLKQSATLTVTVTPLGQPNFSLAAGPATLSLVQGLQGGTSITSAISGSFNNAIALSASGLPNGVSASFAPDTLAAPGNGNSVLTFTVNRGALAGTYPVTVTGNGGGTQQTATVILTVTPSGAQALPNASVLQLYSYSLQASFGTPPYSYQVVTGSLPSGLTLDGYGNIAGQATTAGQFAFSVQVTDSSQPPQQQVFNYTLSAEIQLDSYSGLSAAPVPGCVSSGYFQVMKVNGRWLLADPTCNAFYQRSVFDADRLFILQQIMQSRYGNSTAAWANHSLERMTGWGFNAIDVYTSYYMLPVGTYNNQGAAIKVPFVLFFPTLQQVLTSPQNVGLPEPIKDICRGFDANGYYFYCSNLADIFDPKWQTANINELAVQQSVYTGGFNTDPWVIGVSLGDTDYVFAIKGNGAGTYNVPAYPHPGMLVATVDFQYSGFQDNTLYSKYAWISYLQNKYGTVDALNAAWNTGGFYTAFGDDGGFGNGTGVLDEDGRHTGWFGSDLHDRYFTQIGVNPNLVADMDAFLYQFAYQVYSVQASTIKSYDQNHLLVCGIFGGVGEGGTRLPVLQALKDSGCNVLVGNWNSYYPSLALSGNQAQYDATGLPEYLWYAVGAQADSDVSGYSYPNYGVAFADYPNQLTRGQQYASDQQAIFSAQGTNGDYYVLGTGFWSLTDNNSEKTNFGLISFMDNAYDGQCAVIAAGNNQYGYPCGGEATNYGDFLDNVTQTNSSILEQLLQALLQMH